MKWVIGILIDLIIVGIIVLCTKKGSKDGFAKTLVGFFAFVIAIVMAGVLCAPVANLAYDKALKAPIEDAVYTAVSENLDGGITEMRQFMRSAERAGQTFQQDTTDGFTRLADTLTRLDNLSRSLSAVIDRWEDNPNQIIRGKQDADR